MATVKSWLEEQVWDTEHCTAEEDGTGVTLTLDVRTEFLGTA